MGLEPVPNPEVGKRPEPQPIPSSPAPHAAPPPVSLHSHNVVVSRRLGILARVALVFTRRGLEIESLHVEPSGNLDDAQTASMRLTYYGTDAQARGISNDIHKLIDVLDMQ